MSQQPQSEKNILLKSLFHLPSNRGYFINGKRYYGGDDFVNNGRDVAIIGPDRHLHHWTRRGYIERKLNETDTDWDCLTFPLQQKLVTSRRMYPCPTELTSGGMCSNRFDPEHRKYFYHFTTLDKKGSPIVKGGLVRCRYHKRGNYPCWEKNNGKHANVFYHED